MDTLTLMTIGLYVVSGIIFYVAYRFTKNLIKQHNDIYPLLYGLEEAEKKKQRGES
jgi:hypothetical protein